MERSLKVAANVRRIEVWARLWDTPTFMKEGGKKQPTKETEEK